MTRRMIAGAVLVAAFAVNGLDGQACGDKFLRVGRGGKYPGYAALYPASILIYTPANTRPEGVKALAAILERAGHSAVVSERGTAGVRASRTPFDLVIASYADAISLREELRNLPSRPDLLPVVDKPSKALSAEAHRQFPHLLIPHAMTNVQALAEIDRLMEERQGGVAKPSPASTR